jgi:PAS domain S-box-containing protein
MTPRPRILLHVPASFEPARLVDVLSSHDTRDVVSIPSLADVAAQHAQEAVALLVVGLEAGADAGDLASRLSSGASLPPVLVLHAPGRDTHTRLQHLGLRASLPYVPGDDGPLLRTVDNLLENSQLRTRLAQSEAQYAELLQNTRDAIYILGPTQFVFVNRAFTDLMGYTADEICSKSFDFERLIAPESRPMIMERGRLAALGESLPPRYEFMALNKAGQRLDVAVSVSYIVYGGLPSSLGVLQDITARKQYEKALLRRNRELAVLNDLAATVSRAPDLNTVLETAVERLIAVMGFSAAGISLLQPGQQAATVRVYRGIRAQQLETLQNAPLGEGLIGSAIRTGDVQVVHDLASDPRMAGQDALKQTFKSAVSVPIQARDRVLGSAVGLCVEPREFAPEELSLLLSIGHQLGTAVERATLFDNREVAMKRLLAMDELARALSSTLNQAEVFHVAGQPLPVADLFVFTRVEIQHGMDVLADLLVLRRQGRISQWSVWTCRYGRFVLHGMVTALRSTHRRHTPRPDRRGGCSWRLSREVPEFHEGTRNAVDQGRTAISLRTETTPLTPRAIDSAVARSLPFLAKPDSMTVPLSVSTLIDAASTCLFSIKRDLIRVVMPVSST